MLESLGHVFIEGRQEQLRELGEAPHNLWLKQRLELGERVVEEEPFGHFRGVPRGSQVGLELFGAAGLNSLEGFQNLVAAKRDGERVGPHAVVVWFAEDAVRRVERPEVQLFGGAGAEQIEEVVENAGHQVPGRAGIPAEAVPLEAAGTAAHLVTLFEELHLVSFVGE